MTLIVAKKDEDDLQRWLATTRGFVSALCKFEDKPLDLEPYQSAFLENKSRFRWITKGRQVGFSLIIAVEALARCHLRDGHNAHFVSYSQQDAKEKILVARSIYEDLPLEYQKKLVIDSRTELNFASNSRSRKVSRMISHPSKPPRGRKGDIYLDEFAHYLNDREVYRGSTALIVRSGGQLTGASTPLGRRGMFWEIAEEPMREFPHHKKQQVPWWLCSFFCNDVSRAAGEIRQMPTAEAVEKFSTPPLLEQFDSLPIDDFEQEYCCSFASDAEAVFPYELILPCTTDSIKTASDFSGVPQPEGRLLAGFDVGRRTDRSELAIFEDLEGHYKCRMLKSYINVPFADQEADLRRMLELLPIVRFSIDKMGIGMNLAENLFRDYGCVVPEAFSNQSKERWVTDFKILLQRRRVILPKDRDLVGQIHSIEKKVLPSSKVSYDAKRTSSGHADRFWAIVLACQKDRHFAQIPGRVSVRIIG